MYILFWVCASWMSVLTIFKLYYDLENGNT